MTEFFAHSANPHGRWHPLRQHLNAVAMLAATFAEGSGLGDEAELAGKLHDLGKYGDLFQRRLKGLEQGLDHWSAGATVAVTDTRFRALAACLAIEGHHIGLQAGCGALTTRLKSVAANHPLALRLSDSDFAGLLQRAEVDGVEFPTIRQPIIQKVDPRTSAGTMLDVRMLFSCLVDADFLDTEAHFDGDSSGKVMRPSGPRLQGHLEEASLAIDSFLQATVRTSANGSADVLAVRDELWQAVTAAAQHEPGLFTLTAPTGSGKTLAMLQFALQHARANGLRRIVLAVPYLSIIEQTAKILNSIFKHLPSDFVLEHHSLAGLGTEPSQGDAEASALRGDEERRRRLLAENWDAPIVITTNVQILESLFSNRPSACRKLHRLMGAVIVFDEAQSLPQALTIPTLAALSHLGHRYRSSIVFSTATQPAFDHLDAAVKQRAPSGWAPVELVPTHAGMFERLKRVSVHWPDHDETIDWTALGTKLRNHPQVLCIVNLKRHAQALVEQLSGVDGVLHLSTNLCTAHRRQVLDEVRRRLKATPSEPCRLVATQCIEAGVDVDFPVVYRALAPLEAIAQAAGRCNREGRMAPAGEVHVFEPAARGTGKDPWRGVYPTFSYYQAAQVTRSLGQPDINDPTVFQRYYRKLFDIAQPASQNPALDQAIQVLDFPEVAKLYRLIDTDTIQVVVPWVHAADDFEHLRRVALQGVDRKWMRDAQAIAVAVFRPKRNHPLWSYLMPVKLRSLGGKAESDEWFILQDPNRDDPERCLYHPSMGLRPPEADAVLIA